MAKFKAEMILAASVMFVASIATAEPDINAMAKCFADVSIRAQNVEQSALSDFPTNEQSTILNDTIVMAVIVAESIEYLGVQQAARQVKENSEAEFPGTGVGMHYCVMTHG